MLERYGVWPANANYLYPYFNYEDALEIARAGHSLYQRFMADLPVHWPRFDSMARGLAPVELDPSKHHTDVQHGDIAVRMLLSLATDSAQEFHVNVRNRSSIPNLPEEAIVEVPARVDSSGVTPLPVGELPRGLAGLTQGLIAWQELSVDAAFQGDRNVVVQALIAHPWVRSTAVAERLCDDLLAAHAAHLPQFNRASG
jgi:6-phospho-beta-glucosidase